MSDHWPAILDAIPAVLRHVHADLHNPDLLDIMERRYREGTREHGGDWLTRPPEWFDQESLEEAADHIIYRAMQRIRSLEEN